jgi:uncharacterized protein
MLSMKSDLMGILACPIDKYFPLTLEVSKKDGEDIIEGKICCSKCKRVFPIFNGVPELLPDELRRR